MSARSELSELLQKMAAVLDGTEPIAAALVGLIARQESLGRKPSREDLAELRDLICAVLREHRHWVAGAGIVVAPDLLAGTPRWLEWWWMRASGTPEPLRVNLDETAADFFDYTSAEWYAVPARTGEAHAAGPYVDHLCTNQYSVTLTSPVRYADKLVGVVGADVLVSSIEAMVLPVLTRIAPDAVLATSDGRVVASARSVLAPGHRIDVGTMTSEPALTNNARQVSGVGSWLVCAG